MNSGVIKAFVIKEYKQIIRDASSILIAFILPLILLFLFGFGINFDTNTVKIGIVDEDNTNVSRDLIYSLQNTRYLDCAFFKDVKTASKMMSGGKIRGYAVIPVNFTKEFKKNKNPVIQIITDGSEPNTAKFVASYIQGSVQSFLEYKAKEKGRKISSKIRVIQRAWYNPALKSTYFILPGSLAIIMTMTGCVLTALVIAREWERGTMEALLASGMTKFEFIIAKYITYFILGALSIIFCLVVIIFLFRVPYNGSVVPLLVTSSLFMLTGLGAGLLISTVFKEQFTSSQMAGTIGFMPSMMLSGLIYEIDSMPHIIRFFSFFVPAKYYVSSITSLFLSGTILKTILINSFFMFIFAIGTGVLVYLFTKERIVEC